MREKEKKLGKWRENKERVSKIKRNERGNDKGSGREVRGK